VDPSHLIPLPPDRVWVGPITYCVIPCLPDDPRLEGHRGLTVFGGDAHLIYFDLTRAASEVFEVVWHEVTHALNEACGLDKRRPAINDERIATQHGVVWPAFLLANPKFIAWLETITNFIKSEQEDETCDEPPQA
jgi:hypothetical protein